MPFDVLLLVGVAIGLVLVLLYFMLGRKDKSATLPDAAVAGIKPAGPPPPVPTPIQHQDEPSTPPTKAPEPSEEPKPSVAPVEPEPSPEAAVMSLSETVAALRKLAEPKTDAIAAAKLPSPVPDPPMDEPAPMAIQHAAIQHATEPVEQQVPETPARQPERELASQRLAELKDQELERDTAVREEGRTGWRPVSDNRPIPTSPVGGGTITTDGAWAPSTSEPVSPPMPPTAPEPPPIVTEVAKVQIDPSTKMHPDSAAQLRLSVGQAFSPAAPVSRRDLFAGREEQLETLVDVVFEKGQHAIVYGERGVGKTSLASILTLVFADEPGRLPLRVNCDAGDDYDSLWRKVIDELEVGLDALNQDMPLARKALERALSKPRLAPTDVARVLKQVGPYLEAIIIIDEFDTCSSEKATRFFADTIKTLSDQLVPATLVLLGIADSLDELLAEHASVSRALVHVHMPRMSVPELKEIVKRGLDQLTMDIEDDALDLIARLSQGFPHFTHLLSQSAARSAIDAERPLVTLADVDAASKKLSGRIESWIQDAYDKATSSTHDSIYAQVLLASALAPVDTRGYFAAADVKTPMSGIMGKTYEIPSFIRQLNALSEEDRGPVLLKTGTERKHRYRFVEPQMEPYVIIRSLSDGLIDASLLGRISNGAAHT